jgi:hypothetical protein
MATKRCTACKKWFSLAKFNKRTHASGNVGWCSQCKECRNAVKRKHSKSNYVKKGSLSWETIFSPVDDLGYSLWPPGGRFSALDVKLTLGFGYFSPGMVIRNIKRGCEYVVMGDGEGQELKLC